MASFEPSENTMEVGDVPPKHLGNPEAAALARDKGWVAPEEYDYSKYTQAGPDHGAAEAGEPGNVLEEEVQWASNAAKYEWSDEYGDVGPENPELEKMLFQSDLIIRAGVKFDKYVCCPCPLRLSLIMLVFATSK